ncbi:hypothetical protein SPRG_07638 [Saprolegnia parasitica CBS 223.65]|uniref:Uncharacterized protein n=1 Tax=Saprolegnia parasitica (strain CBS 223.65) TaxID=695850 RepID=A0A067C820_SAPPC|nr:hypothetical protein SPRG_07638 [Saprolegnia parasitica CBS 223.65]KDO26924.1 hypothetical protein SPRG_07638 [Saprolegnia parasitica CBS 223.65]|eukprot:XP_012202306.1 hypothetical protein SPRG_07638 [Saprolegnia parasitica CBS 223.65]
MPDLDCAPMDPASAPYEDALESIPRDACATFEYAYMGRLDDAMAPGLVLAAFPGRRKWSQDARVLDAVLANHPSGILPSTSLQQDNGRDPPPTMWTLGLGRTLTDHFAWGSNNVVAVLSHVAIRRPASDAAPLEPLLRDRNSAGTLLVSLPTYLEGGALSVHFNGARTVSDNDHRVCSTYSVTVAHRAATLAMAPIMAGHAVVAVYDLVGDSAMSASTSPISPGVLAAIAMLTTIATAPPTKYPLLGFGIRPSYTFTTFDDLGSGSQERAFVHALVATEMYDVAMVHYLPVPADDDDTGPFVIARAALHPSLGLPSSCALALRGRLVPAFLCSVRVEDLRRSRDYRSTSLVFWHKVHRPIVLGFEAATDALATTPEKPMRRDLVEGLLEHYVDACDAMAATREIS